MGETPKGGVASPESEEAKLTPGLPVVDFMEPARSSPYHLRSRKTLRGGVVVGATAMPTQFDRCSIVH